VRSWQGRIDEEGQGALVRMAEPVNKFPDFVRYLVRELKALLPAMGKVRIAQVLARAGLHLGATTVGRMLRETEPGGQHGWLLRVVPGRDRPHPAPNDLYRDERQAGSSSRAASSVTGVWQVKAFPAGGASQT